MTANLDYCIKSRVGKDGYFLPTLMTTDGGGLDLGHYDCKS